MQLGTDPTAHNVLLTEPLLSSESDKIRIASIMFEKFGVPAMQSTYSAGGTVYSTGRTTALVVESDDDVTVAMAYFKG